MKFNIKISKVHSISFFALLGLIGLLIVGCKKDPISQSIPDSTTLTSDRNEDYPSQISISYYLDGTSISERTYNSLGPSNWFHSTSKVNGDTTKIEGHAFSSKLVYEDWGINNGIAVKLMNDFDDRLQFLADSLGITALVESGIAIPTALSQTYLDLVQAEYNSKFQSASPTLYSGCKFYKDDCNPSDPNCLPGGAEMALIMTAPTWLHTFTPWMEDNAEAWEPRLSQPSVGSKVTLRAWSYPYYITPPWQNWKKKHTVVFGSAPPPGITKIWTPFIGPISVWHNRISSWMIFPLI